MFWCFLTNKLNSQTNGLLKKKIKYLIGTKLALNSSKWILNFYSPEPIIYSGDHDPSLPHEPQRLVPPLESFEYQGDFSSQLTEVASKIMIYLHYIFSKRSQYINELQKWVKSKETAGYNGARTLSRLKFVQTKLINL